MDRVSSHICRLAVSPSSCPWSRKSWPRLQTSACTLPRRSKWLWTRRQLGDGLGLRCCHDAAAAAVGDGTTRRWPRWWCGRTRWQGRTGQGRRGTVWPAPPVWVKEENCTYIEIPAMEETPTNHSSWSWYPIITKAQRIGYIAWFKSCVLFLAWAT